MEQPIRASALRSGISAANNVRLRVLAALLLAAAACSSWPIGPRDLPGTYVMNRGQAADTLVLLEQGTYRRVYRRSGDSPVIDTGTWSVDTVHKELVVTLQGFWQRWRAETEMGVMRRTVLTSGTWRAPLERTLSGSIKLIVDSDVEWAYVRRGRAR
jgi:hypothetical protein